MKTVLAFHNVIEPERATMPPVLNEEPLESDNGFLAIPNLDDVVGFESRNGPESRRGCQAHVHLSRRAMSCGLRDGEGR